MATLNPIIISLNLADIALVMILVLLLAVVFWLAARQKRVKLTASFSSLQKELADSRVESTALKEQIQRLESQTYLVEFRDESVYLITAMHTIEQAEDRHTYGLVRTESQALKPFFTNQRMDHLQVGDFITYVQDELVKIGDKSANDAFEQKPETGAETLAPPESELETMRSDPWSGQDMIAGASFDQTIIYERTSGGFDNFDELYAGFPYLEVLTGNDQGAIHYLMFGRSSIGRGESCNFTINDDGSSKVHCEIVFESRNFVLKDRQSTNGTFCNGAQIQEATLNFGDTIKVGNSEMIFTCRGFELKDNDPEKAISLFERCLQREPDFVIALKHLAFLMERDIARRKKAKPLWDRINMLESSQSS